jgi:alkylated DNA repair dioxygenase AlkB
MSGKRKAETPQKTTLSSDGETTGKRHKTSHPHICLLKDPDGAYAYVLRNGLGKELADELFDHMQALPVDGRDKETIKTDLLGMDAEAYRAYQLRMAGFTHDRYQFFKALSRRLVCAHHLPDTKGKTSYEYSGQRRSAMPMKQGDAIHRTCVRVAELTGVEFDFCLSNAYRGLEDYITHHRDDEKDLAPGPISSCVVGASRTFEFKYKKREKTDRPDASCGADRCGRVRALLHHGDVLVMVRQGRWTHSVPSSGPGIQLIPHTTPDGTTTTVRFSATLRKMHAR